ncbi:MAG: aldo/keto reductase [Alphaproteobacteria bacterium]|nr:aldo/keto reductase [Alphaproteobacteria bacterium]
MLNISKIGFGGLTISGVWGPTDDQTSIQAIHKAIEEKITWIDTSPIYGLGHSENIIGEALKEKRDQMLIATKCGLFLGKDRKAEKNLKPEFIFQDIEQSLHRLKVSEIDLYQCHWPDPTTPVEETWEAMRELVKQGKVREIGVCNFDIELVKRIHKIHPVYSLQIPYNIIRKEHEIDLIPYCQQNNIHVLTYSPLHLGLLAGNYDPSRLSPEDRRLKAKEWGSEESITLYLAFIEKMKIVAKAKNISVAQLALAWILNNPAITSVIAGMRTPLHVSQNAAAFDIELSDSEKAFLTFNE